MATIILIGVPSPRVHLRPRIVLAVMTAPFAVMHGSLTTRPLKPVVDMTPLGPLAADAATTSNCAVATATPVKKAPAPGWIDRGQSDPFKDPTEQPLAPRVN